jgi:hypothetical protein
MTTTVKGIPWRIYKAALSNNQYTADANGSIEAQDRDVRDLILAGCVPATTVGPTGPMGPTGPA